MEFKSFDNKIIHIYEWDNVKKPKGVIQIIHGMAEHAGRYEEFAKFLNSNGYIVIADDHRGHGKTDPDTLGYCSGNMFENTVLDEEKITKYYKNKYPGLKYFIFGFSYGSFITQTYIKSCGSLIDGAVIGGSSKKKDFSVYLGSAVAEISNLLGREQKKAVLIAALSFGLYSKRFRDGEWISHDNRNNKKYHSDELCGFICSYRFYADFFRGLRNLYTEEYKEALNKDLPLLLIGGENDPVSDMGKGMKKLYRFYKEAGVKDVKLILLEGYRHEFLGIKNGQEECFNKILKFFDTHI